MCTHLKVRMNSFQKATLIIGGVILTMLLLFPPWQEAALRELAYRKDIGRGSLLRPPKPVPVDCYFVGCQTAPASYFHVVLNSRLHIAQCVTVVFITLSLFWLFLRRSDGTQPTLNKTRTRLLFSVLIALGLPPFGINNFTLAAFLFQIPKVIIDQGEKWQGFILFISVVFMFCSCVVYGVVTLALALYKATSTK